MISTFRKLPVLALCFASVPAYASLTLTAAGVTDGFTLSTFVSGYNAQYGPLAQGVATNGNIITGSLLNTRIYVFSDIDGQNLSSAITSNSYTCITGNCNFAITTAGGQVYGAQAVGGIYEHFANDGTFTPIPNLAAAGLRDGLGMWGDPVNGHIISESTQGLVDIDPIAGTFRTINNVTSIDGVSVSANGSVIYAENNGTVQSYNLTTGALIHTYSTGHSPDGTGVISGGLFDGEVIVNNNDGTVGLLNPLKADGDPTQFTIIANSGTRGDFVSPDTSNGTLFLSQTDEVARLSCGSGCSIGSVTTTPEPGTVLSFGLGMMGLAVMRHLVRQRVR